MGWPIWGFPAGKAWLQGAKQEVLVWQRGAASPGGDVQLGTARNGTQEGPGVSHVLPPQMSLLAPGVEPGRAPRVGGLRFGVMCRCPWPHRV